MICCVTFCNANNNGIGDEMNMQQAVNAVINKQDLSSEEMHTVMQSIMTGEATPAQIGGFLVALRCKGETVNEISAAAKVMRELSSKVEVDGEHLVDTCGTGGSGAKTFNVSTASAIVAAAAGCQVAKHGNRSITSNSGSADVLEQAGVNLALSAEQVAACVKQCGLGFMFAPNHHSAMKHAIGPRKELAVRTIFNVLGPLTNPASAPNQVLGVFESALTNTMASVLQQLGSQHVMVVHAEDGLDELSIASPTQVSELKDGKIKTYAIKPEEVGLASGKLSDITVDSAKESLAMIESVLNNQRGTALNMVALNAGASIYVSGKAETFEAGVKLAKIVIADGAAKAKLAEFIKTSHAV